MQIKIFNWETEQELYWFEDVDRLILSPDHGDTLFVRDTKQYKTHEYVVIKREWLLARNADGFPYSELCLYVQETPD